MSTYNYNTLTRANDGNAFDFTTNSSVLYVDELPTGVTLQLRIDSQGNPPITLRPKTQLRFKQNDRLFFTPSAATAGTIRIFLFLDESNLLEFDQSQYSSESTITGTVDVNVVGQSGADPFNVNISSQTGQDPLHNDIVQIGGTTAPVSDLTTILGATNPSNTSFHGWSYLNTGTAILASNSSGNPAYITAVSANAFGLTSVDNTIFLGLYDGTPTLVANFIVFTFNQAVTANTNPDGTFGYSMNFCTPIEIPNGYSVRLVGGANTWSSGSVWGHTT